LRFSASSGSSEKKSSQSSYPVRKYFGFMSK
jgi:hypothetical protein